MLVALVEIIICTKSHPSTSRMIFEISNAGSVIEIYSNTWTPDADTWYHVAVTRKDGVFNFYLDGVEVGENFNYQDISIPNIDAKVYFGSLAGASNTSTTVSQISSFRNESILERTVD